MPRRTEEKARVKWTDKMIADAISCKERAKALVASTDPPRRNGRKIGYMEIMLDFWNQEGYEHLGFTKQNLSDRIREAERCKQTNLQPIADVIATERVTVDNQTDVTNEIPQNADNEIPQASTVSNETGRIATPEILEIATKVFNDISADIGDFSDRKWGTKIKTSPSSDAVNDIDAICKTLFEQHITLIPEDTGRDLWHMDCIVYAAVVAWLQHNDVDTTVKPRSSGKRHGEEKWLREINTDITETRRFISQCAAEKERLKSGGRLTKKIRRNRKRMMEHLHDGEVISCMTLTIHSQT